MFFSKNGLGFVLGVFWGVLGVFSQTHLVTLDTSNIFLIRLENGREPSFTRAGLEKIAACPKGDT
jgi:hypothetical protein